MGGHRLGLARGVGTLKQDYFVAYIAYRWAFAKAGNAKARQRIEDDARKIEGWRARTDETQLAAVLQQLAKRAGRAGWRDDKVECSSGQGIHSTDIQGEAKVCESGGSGIVWNTKLDFSCLADQVKRRAVSQERGIAGCHLEYGQGRFGSMQNIEELGRELLV
jgi:hypothetical protein